MKKILFSVMVLCFVESVGHCQEKASPLTLTIKSDKQVYEVGEEIKIKFKFKNDSPAPLIFNSRLVFASLDIVGPDGLRVSGREVKLKIGPPTETEFVQIGDGEAWGTDFVVVSPYEGGGFAGLPYLFKAYNMNKVGVYTIKGSYRNGFKESFNYQTGEKRAIDAWTGTLISNTITIKVKKKEPESQFGNAPDKRITAIGELLGEEGGDKIHFAKYKILEVIRGKIDSEVVTVGYYFYTLKGQLPHKALLYLKKYEGETKFKDYYIAIDYSAEKSILDYDAVPHTK